MQRLINEARRVLIEDAEHEDAMATMHGVAAKKLDAALKSAGLKSRFVAGSHWSTGMLVYWPENDRDAAYHVTVYAQHVPRPGYQFGIKLQPPMFGRSSGVEDVMHEMPSAFRDIHAMVRKYGKTEIHSDDRVVAVGGDVPDDKVEQLIKELPGLMPKIGKLIARAFKEAG